MKKKVAFWGLMIASLLYIELMNGLKFRRNPLYSLSC